jgi:hypothetical protein
MGDKKIVIRPSNKEGFQCDQNHQQTEQATKSCADFFAESTWGLKSNGTKTYVSVYVKAQFNK